MFCARGQQVCRAQFLGVKLNTAEGVSNMINLFTRDAPWERLWLNEKSYQMLLWCQTTLSNSLPRWCVFFLENNTGLLLPSPGESWEGQRRWLVLGTGVASGDQSTDLCGESRPPYGSPCPGSTVVKRRWQVWLQTRICSGILLGITVRTSYRSKSSTIVRWVLFSLYERSNSWWGK